MTLSGYEPPSVGGKGRKEIIMPLQDFITRCRESKAYFRGLVIRAVEDAIVLLVLCIGIWLVCIVFGTVFRILGVA